MKFKENVKGCFLSRYTIFKDHITLRDYEIHDGMNLELYYQ